MGVKTLSRGRPARYSPRPMKKLTALRPSSAPSLTVCDADAAKPKAKEVPHRRTEDFLLAGRADEPALSTFDLKPEELAQVQKGLADGVGGVRATSRPKNTFRSCRKLQRARIAVVAEKAAAAGVAFLDKASKEAGAAKTTSGIVIKHTKEGTGAHPPPPTR